MIGNHYFKLHFQYVPIRAIIFFCHKRYIRLVCTCVALGVVVNKCIHLLIPDIHRVVKSVVISTERTNERTTDRMELLTCPACP